jgi:hypothetical protein
MSGAADVEGMSHNCYFITSAGGRFCVEIFMLRAVSLNAGVWVLRSVKLLVIRFTGSKAELSGM